MMQACINTSMLAVCRSLNGFPRERATVARETRRGAGGYGPGPYFFSKLLVEIPVDAVFPVVFGLVLHRMAGLNVAGRGALLGTLALQTAAASALGLSVGALSPSRARWRRRRAVRHGALHHARRQIGRSRRSPSP